MIWMMSQPSYVLGLCYVSELSCLMCYFQFMFHLSYQCCFDFNVWFLFFIRVRVRLWLMVHCFGFSGVLANINVKFELRELCSFLFFFCSCSLWTFNVINIKLRKFNKISTVVMLILVLVKDSLRSKFKSLSLSLSLRV